jgi:hypothetical protein
MYKFKNQYLNEKQVSELTGIAVATLQNHRFYGIGLPYCKINRSVRYKLDAIEKYMDEHTINPTI